LGTETPANKKGGVGPVTTLSPTIRRCSSLRREPPLPRSGTSSHRERPELCGPRAVQARLHAVVLGSPVPTPLAGGRGLTPPNCQAPKGARRFSQKDQVPT